MANKKISELVPLNATPDANDILPLNDTSQGTTFSVKVSELQAATQSLASNLTDISTIAQANGTMIASDGTNFVSLGEIDSTGLSAIRADLGLGTAATTASTDYATTAQGDKADSALQSGEEAVQSVAGKTGTVSLFKADISDLVLGTAATLDVGVSIGNVVQLSANNTLPILDGSNLTGISSAFFTTIAESTTARTLSDSDNGKVIVCSNANDVTITLPDGLTSGFNCTLVQEGSGIVKVLISGSATLSGYNSNNATAGRYASVNIYPIGTDSYVLDGTAQAIAPPGANALNYPNGIFFSPLATYYISTQPIMHFDSDYMDGADDANNPTNGATGLSSWGDRSGGATNYDLSQATAAEQPTYYSVGGLTGVTFDSGDYFDLANSITTPTSLTQVIIATNTDVNENSLIGLATDSTAATSVNTLFGTGGQYGTQIKLGGTSQTTNQPTFSQTNPNIHVVTKAGTNWKYWYQGGSSVYDITASYSKTLTTLGAGYYTGLDARIHEVLVFNSTLSISDLNVIKDYANNKYSAMSASTFS